MRMSQFETAGPALTRRPVGRRRCFASVVVLALAFILTLGPSLGARPRPRAEVLVSAPVTTAAFQRISASYIDPSRFDFEKGLDESLRAIEALVPEFQADYKPGDTVLKAQMNLARKTFNVSYLSSIPATLDILKKVYIFIEENLESEVDLHDIEYIAVNGFMNILDPHSRLLAPDIYREFMVTTSGSFGGIGIVVGLRENRLTVISPLDDTPAARAGMRAGDEIIRIEDESTENMPLDEAVKRLRGPEGSPVNMTIQREGEAKPIEVTLVRARIEIKSVSHELLPGNVGYVRVTGFQENTARDLKDALAAMQGEVSGVDKFKGLVLDLRNNPGGLLDQAIQVSDLFLETGDIVSTVTRASKKPERAQHFRTEPDYPVVVLVNEGSASASEIVAGALKNNGRAIVLGNRTFGKGSVQNLFELPLGAALKLTMAQYLTPGDQSIQSVGVAPDILLHPVQVTADEIRMSESSRRREEKQDYHLEGIKTATATERYRLSYLIEVNDKGKSEEELEREAVEDEYNNRKKVDLTEDYPIDLARRLIVETKAWKREAFYSGSLSMLKGEEGRQSRLITESLARRNLDWSECETKGQVKLTTSVRVLDENKKTVQFASAGADHFLELTVANSGRGAVCRLRASTESDIPFLHRREFVLGTLAPGETTKQMIPFKLAKGTIGRTSDIEFAFVADEGRDVYTLAAPVVLRSNEQPAFALSYELIDKTSENGARGNGDGMVQPGEIIGLKFTAKNVGKGASDSSVLRLRTTVGALAEIPEGRGNFKFPALAPGAESQTTLYVELKPDYLDATLGLEASLIDNEFGAGLVRKLELNVARTGAKALTSAEIEKTRGQTFAPPQVIVDGVGLTGLSSNGNEITLTGELRDDVRVKDFYLAINGEKTYYRSYEAAAAERFDRFRFNTKVPLEPGSNFVLIVTRDSDDLATRYPLYIWSTLPKPPPEEEVPTANLQASVGDPIIRSRPDDGSRTILVNPIVAAGGADAALAAKLTAMFSTSAGKASCAKVVANELITDALKRMGMSGGCEAEACQMNVAREVKADVLVRGELTRAGAVHIFSVVVSDLATGRVLLSDKILAAESDLLKKAENLAGRVSDVIPCR